MGVQRKETMEEIIILTVEEDGEISYQINNENDTYLDNADTLDEAMTIAKEMAEASPHHIEFIKVKVEPVNIEDL